MKPYRTARVICTYKCDRECKGCVNTLHAAGMRVPPIGMIDMQNHDEIILTGGEPMLFVDKLIDLVDHMRMNRLILYTNAPSYAQLYAVSRFFAGITITLHDDDDARRFGLQFARLFVSTPHVMPMFFVRVYEAVTIRLPLYSNVQYKMCEWVKPEECRLQSNEEVFRLQGLWV